MKIRVVDYDESEDQFSVVLTDDYGTSERQRTMDAELLSIIFHESDEPWEFVGRTFDLKNPFIYTG